MNKNYDDIINLPHYVSKTRPRMSLEQRSAQFAPFAALTGYEDEISETGRLTSTKVELDEAMKQILDEKLQTIIEKLPERPEVTITYFIPDNKKEGGKYVTITDNIKKIDRYKNVMILVNNKAIKIDDILDYNFI